MDFSDAEHNEQWKKATRIDRPLLIYFYADRCGSCVRIKPVINAIAEEYFSQYTYMPVNVDDRANDDLSRQFRIRSIPGIYLVNHQSSSYKKLSISMDKDYYRKQLDEFFMLD